MAIGTDLSDPKVFAYWSKTAEEDPEEFEQMRRNAIEEIMLKAPERIRERLRRIQWRVDMERSRASNPLSGCLRISEMMWKSVYDEGGLLEAMNELMERCRDLNADSAGNAEPSILRRQASILPFPKK